METKDWDEVINSHTGEFKLLAPHDNHDGHPYAILPIVPKDWFILMGHLSQNAQNDAWLSHIAYMLDIFERIDVTFVHDRADITGNNDDETFKNRKYMEGNPEDPADFGHPQMQQARMHHASKIDWFLKRTKQITAPSYFEDMLMGKVNPFANLTDGHNPQGAGQVRQH